MSNLASPSDRDSHSPLAADKAVLPPVEPPAAGFIMQLFFIPMIIVGIIVMIWLMFSWLAHMGSRPEQLVDDIDKLNHASWQKALTLANMLRDPGNDSLRRNSELAARLASVLERQIDESMMDQDRIWFRMYLCRALGEFQVSDGLTALQHAASSERDVKEQDVRRAALEAIGLLAGRANAISEEQIDELLPALRAAASDAQSPIRSRAAFALGLVNHEDARDILEMRLADSDPDVRYNAATGLARQGDGRAVPALIDMLVPQVESEAGPDASDADAQWKRTLVIRNALRAIRQLAAKNPDLDLATLRPAIDDLLQSDVSGAARVEAEDAKRLLNDRAQPVAVP
jgi:HEAT repeat protein